jgi:hypothetical protein
MRTAMHTAPDRAFAPIPPYGSPLTKHATIRLKQRGVDPSVLDCLIAYGRRDHDHHGAEIVRFDADALRRVRLWESIQLWKRVAEAGSLYAVVDSDGLVITTGHRRRRVRRDMGTRQGRACRGWM